MLERRSSSMTIPIPPAQTAHDLLTVLKDLMSNESKRITMATAARDIGTTTGAKQIIEIL